MKTRLDMSGRKALILSAAMLGFAIAGWASPQAGDGAKTSAKGSGATNTQRGMTPPLEIAREGYVFAGGSYSTVKDSNFMTGQIYA